MLGETLVGPLLVFLAGFESVPMGAVIGGVVIIASLAANRYYLVYLPWFGCDFLSSLLHSPTLLYSWVAPHNYILLVLLNNTQIFIYLYVFLIFLAASNSSYFVSFPFLLVLLQCTKSKHRLSPPMLLTRRLP
jgi:hypothetical protein